MLSKHPDENNRTILAMMTAFSVHVVGKHYAGKVYRSVYRFWRDASLLKSPRKLISKTPKLSHQNVRHARYVVLQVDRK